MNVKDKVILFTGGANGSGKALCETFTNYGARKIVVARGRRAGKLFAGGSNFGGTVRR